MAYSFLQSKSKLHNLSYISQRGGSSLSIHTGLLSSIIIALLLISLHLCMWFFLFLKGSVPCLTHVFSATQLLCHNLCFFLMCQMLFAHVSNARERPPSNLWWSQTTLVYSVIAPYISLLWCLCLLHFFFSFEIQ